MKRRTKWILALIVGLVLVVPVARTQEPQGAPAGGPPAGPQGQQEPEPKPYDKVITKDAKTISGIFSVHLVKDNTADQKGAAVANNEIKLGEAARQTGQYDAALKHFRAAVEAAPDMLEAHEQFAMAMVMAETSKLRKELAEKDSANAYLLARKRVGELYEKWAKEHSDQILYRYFAVYYGHPRVDLAAKAEYQRMTETDPKFAPPYAALANFAVMEGDDASQREYLRKASELRPDYTTYRFQYIYAFYLTNPAEYPKLADDFVQRFPHDSTKIAAVLQLAANCTPNARGKIGYLQRALEAAAPTYRHSVLWPLLAAYLSTDPDKAAELATKELQAARANASTSKFFSLRLEQAAAYCRSYAKARRLLAQGKAHEAAAVGLKIEPTTGWDPFPLAQLKSEIMSAQGKRREAYDAMVAAAAPAPGSAFMNALEPLGRKIGKEPSEIRADLLKASLSKASPINDWELPDLATGAKKRTVDYRGKILYLNYWAIG